MYLGKLGLYRQCEEKTIVC